MRIVVVVAITLLAVGCSSENPTTTQSNALGETPFLYYPLDEFFGGVSCDWDCYYNDNGSAHAALDLRTGTGKQIVRASADGWLQVSPDSGGCGNMATIAHPNGYRSKYCHFTSYIGASRQVHRGDAIGISGATGWTDPVGYDHVHFQVLDSSGYAVHPGCPPGIADWCDDYTSSSLWVSAGGVVVRANEQKSAGGFDFDGDGCEDVAARVGYDASLRLFRGNCAGGFAAEGTTIGSSFGDFTKLFSPGDFDGDGCADIVGRRASDDTLRLYGGNCQSGYATENRLIGSSWGDFKKLFSPGDFDGDGCSDIIGHRASDETLRLYAGDCHGGYSRENVLVGSEFGDFDMLLGARDWDGDGCADIIGRRQSDATLRLYAGDCHAGYSRENVLIGTSWQSYDALVGKDFNHDGCTDVVGRRSDDHTLRLFLANCSGGWASEGDVIGTDWASMDAIF
jgi:uncharacterized membrane protein